MLCCPPSCKRKDSQSREGDEEAPLLKYYEPVPLFLGYEEQSVFPVLAQTQKEFAYLHKVAAYRVYLGLSEVPEGYEPDYAPVEGYQTELSVPVGCQEKLKDIVISGIDRKDLPPFVKDIYCVSGSGDLFPSCSRSRAPPVRPPP